MDDTGNMTAAKNIIITDGLLTINNTTRGVNTVTLNTNKIPTHNHTIVDNGYSHEIKCSRRWVQDVSNSLTNSKRYISCNNRNYHIYANKKIRKMSIIIA